MGMYTETNFKTKKAIDPNDVESDPDETSKAPE